jgi:hypothetical protein
MSTTLARSRNTISRLSRATTRSSGIRVR